MNDLKKKNILIPGLFIAIAVLSILNLISCGSSNTPMITTIVPNSTPISVSSHTLLSNTGVTITGSHFGTSQGSEGQVYFDTTLAGTAASWTDSTIVLSSIPTVPGALALTTTGTSYTAAVYVSANGQASNIVSFVYNGT